MRVLGAFLFNTLCNFGIGLIVAKFLGPAEYGRFALTLAIALTIQIALLDWIRLAAVRFYSERVRAAEPSIRRHQSFWRRVVGRDAQHLWQ